MLAAGQSATRTVFPLAALPFASVPTSTTEFLFAKKPHWGLDGKVPIWEPRFLYANHQSPLGLPVCSYDSGRRSRCTSKERDAETGLDFFGARYFSSAQGRFTSADEPFADQDENNPQSWNLYAYGRNNPLRNIDPTGRCSQGAGGYTDEGSGLFPGPCSGGQIGEQKAGNNSTTVGVGRDEANLIMLQGIGAAFTAHGVAQFVSDAAQATGRLTGATDVAQCLTSGITGSGCSKTGLAMAAIPFGPGRLARILLRHSALSVVKNVSKFAKGLDDAAHVESMVESALASPTRASGYADGAAYIDANLGVTIGTDPTGKATTTIRVVLDNAGNVHSAFPVPQIH
jgi:RHS repeat-associated protein